MLSEEQLKTSLREVKLDKTPQTKPDTILAYIEGKVVHLDTPGINKRKELVDLLQKLKTLDDIKQFITDNLL